SSDDESVATVSSSGLVTAVGAGTASITVKTTDGGYIATCIVTVVSFEVPVDGVTIDETEMHLTIGSTGQITETVSPANATDKSVAWSSDDESVATVSSSGLVTAVGAGTAAIFVWTNDGDYIEICFVTVTE
ncbi:MAG: Ig-like domain-containing protein, partial [Candidatus Methanoplasma sp.]|nr:Ig-like domain-containing protein [Candidatus Methanoplasma sp.]